MLLVLILVPGRHANSQTTIYVNGAATGADNGSSWDDAFVYPRDAFLTANPGDVVFVARFVYYPDKSNIEAVEDDPSVSFDIPSGVSVYGGFAGGETSVDERDPDPSTNETVFSGAISATLNSDHVVSIVGADPSTLLTGFTITGGGADGQMNGNGGGVIVQDSDARLENIIVSNNFASGFGGGIYVDGPDCNPTFVAVKVVQNQAESGGGVYLNGCVSEFDFLVAEENEATSDGGGMAVGGGAAVNSDYGLYLRNIGMHGGGLYNQGSAEIRNSSFVDNSALAHGGGAYNQGFIDVRNSNFFENKVNEILGDGGGIYTALVSVALLLGNGFTRNEAANNGGGVYISENVTIDLHDTYFIGNSASGNGGGLYVSSGQDPKMNLLFNGNVAGGDGGGMYNNASTGTFNSTFANNTANRGGAIANNVGFSSFLHNSVISDNSAVTDPDIFLESNASYNLWSSLLEGGLTAGGADIQGSVYGNALFEDVDGEDGIPGNADDNLSLSTASPGFDTGSPSGGLTDYLDRDEDGDSFEPWPDDLQGKPRDQGANPDMGAYEGTYLPIELNNRRFTADLSLTKTADKEVARVGEAVTYTITVHNDGPQNVGQVKVSEELHGSLVYTGSSGDGHYNIVSRVWDVGEVPVGEDKTITITTIVTAAVLINNVSCVAGASLPDPDFSFDLWLDDMPTQDDCDSVELNGATGTDELPGSNDVSPITDVYPNPFNQEVNINFVMESPASVQVSIYDVLGRKVATLLDDHIAIGDQHIRWGGQTDSGTIVSNGVYFVSLKVGQTMLSVPVVLAR